MQVDPVSASHAESIYQELKFWLPLITAGGFLWKVFQGVNWLKGLKSDVLDVKAKMEAQTSTFTSQIAQQTNAIVGELKEIRQDFRIALSPPPRLARARSAKKMVAAE